MSEPQIFLNSIYKAEINVIYKILRKTSLNPVKIVDQKQYSALHIAALNGHYAVLEFLLSYVSLI